jgi:hypothetical protein
MTFANAVVCAVLRSPLHRLLSGSTAVVSYTGRRTGRTISTPTQYARRGDDVIVLVGQHQTKTWWRNFRQDHDVDVLIGRLRMPMVGRAVMGSDEPEAVRPLLDAYRDRFPRTGGVPAGETDGSLARDTVMVHCRPRPAPSPIVGVSGFGASATKVR